MKRHKSLYKLSHEHHHGLVKARRLINLTINEKDKFRVYSKDFIEFYKQELLPHFRQEEEILLPVLYKFTSETNKELLETLKQHIKIHSFIFDLREKIINNEEIDLNTLHAVGRMLDDHIRFEERILFPTLENLIPTEYIIKIGIALNSGSDSTSSTVCNNKI